MKQMYPRGFSFSGSYQVIIIIIFIVQTIIDLFPSKLICAEKL